MKNLTIFENFKIRRHYDEKTENWYFSVIDIVAALTDQHNYKKAQSYWTTLKSRLKKEGSQVVTDCDKLKLEASDGKKYFTDIAMDRNSRFGYFGKSKREAERYQCFLYI